MVMPGRSDERYKVIAIPINSNEFKTFDLKKYKPRSLELSLFTSYRLGFNHLKVDGKSLD